MGSERGQGTVEWVATLLVVSLAMLGLVATGVRVPGTSLARAVADRILCAAPLADGCGDEPTLIAAYGTEIGKLVRRHMPTIGFEEGSRAVPVDFRRCRSTECGDGAESGLVHRTDERLPVTAFVHVVDCRAGASEETEAAGADCSGDRAGNLYIQYWTYYANSAGFISSKREKRFQVLAGVLETAFGAAAYISGLAGQGSGVKFPKFSACSCSARAARRLAPASTISGGRGPHLSAWGHA